jgi:hypothetical protein
MEKSVRKPVPNSIQHPDAWKFWLEQCRNITEEPEINARGKYMYRIPVPDRSGNFLYGETLYHMWNIFIETWYRPSLESPSVYGKIQYIVSTF